MEMHSPFPALRDFHLKVKRLTMICASLALLHPLLSLTHWIFGSLMLPYKSSSRSAKYVRWCDSCSLATPMQRAELNTARQSSHKSPARDDGAGGPPIVISTEAKRSGEISPSDGTGGITLGDLSTQSFIKAFSICPIPTCGSARDDGVGERPHRHFDRSKAEWRNLTPPWYRKHWGGRSLDSEFHRSGFPLTPIPAHPPARDDDIGGHPYRHFDRSGAEWRNLTPQWAKKELGFRRWLFRRAALPSLWGREADQSAR